MRLFETVFKDFLKSIIFRKNLSNCGKLILFNKSRFFGKKRQKRVKFCIFQKSFPKKDDSFYLNFEQLSKVSKTFRKLVPKAFADFSTV